MRRIALLTCLLLGGIAAAEDSALAPSQFAEGFELDAVEGAAIGRVALPEAVYRTIRRADLGDVAVFNANGEAVPIAFEPASDSTPGPAAEESLPFYPVTPDANGAVSGSLHIRVDGAGTVVSIDAPAGSAPPARTAGAWIVDAGERYAELRALRLQWAPTTGRFVQQLTIQQSADLQDWQPIAWATIAELDHAGHQLRQDTIEFAGAGARFLRIDWPGGPESLEMQAVLGRLQGAEQPLVRSYSAVQGRATQGEDADWVFDAGGPLPVDRLRVQLPGDNNLAELRVWSRAQESDPWAMRGTVLAYRLTVDGNLVESAEAGIMRTRERWWRLEALNGDRGALGSEPVIELGWLPDTLLFLARGEDPFMLAAGSATRIVTTQPVNSLLGTIPEGQRDSLVADAWAGEAHTLGGATALVVPAPPVPWQRYLMWGVLVAAVAVLLKMALSLLRNG